ncbi:MAG: isoaspartyl peptidase/L-asparaginase [Pyrodictiaceae archaeon]
MARLVAFTLEGLGDRVVFVHGGAGTWLRLGDSSLRKRVLEILRRASMEGLKKLNEKDLIGSIVESISILEDSGILNAGLGSVLNYMGELEMDAGLMLGDLRAAGVGAVTYPRNPIRLAAAVLEKTSHVLIVGRGADMLAEKLGLERHPGPTEESRRRWSEARRGLKEGGGPQWAKPLSLLYGGTVGSVALLEGKTAAGASTGGIILKGPGRVGDSAIPGAGFYAEDNVGACSATGIGETIILGRPCQHVINLLSQGVPIYEAARAAVARHTSLFGENTLGIIVVDAKGNIAGAINTQAMPVAYASPKKADALFLGLEDPDPS